MSHILPSYSALLSTSRLEGPCGHLSYLTSRREVYLCRTGSDHWLKKRPVMCLVALVYSALSFEVTFLPITLPPSVPLTH